MDTIYRQLQRKLNTLGLGLPETDQGYELEYLEELFSPEEADFALKMDLGMHTTAEFAESMQMPLEEVDAMLRAMAKHSIVFRLHDGDKTFYYLLPVIHGFLEFGIDRFTPSIARSFSKHYVNGMGRRFYGSTEPLFRALPIRRGVVENDACLPEDDFEAIIRRQDKIALTPCFCRTSSNMNPKATGCKLNPDYSELCIVFGIFADFYVENGNGRYITMEEALEHMRRCDINGNIIQVLNSQNVEVMCSCCSCCCGVMKALIMYGGPSADLASNYKVHYEESECAHCGICEKRCNMGAITMDENKNLTVNTNRCLGCGVCVTTCPSKALKLHRKLEDEVYHSPTENVLELYDYVRELRRKTSEI